MADTTREVLSFEAPAARAGERGSGEGRGGAVVIALIVALALGLGLANLIAPAEAPDVTDAPLAWSD